MVRPALCVLLVSALMIGGALSCSRTATTRATPVNSPHGSGPVSFRQLRVKVLEPHCIRCHGWAKNEHAILSKHSPRHKMRYVEPGQPGASLLYRIVETGEMPRNAAPLAPALVSLLERYVLHATPRPPQPGDPTRDP